MEDGSKLGRRLERTLKGPPPLRPCCPDNRDKREVPRTQEGLRDQRRDPRKHGHWGLGAEGPT